VLAVAAAAVSFAAVSARPPAAYLETGAARVPLTVSSWCWAARCGAPIARSRRTAFATRGAAVRITLSFAATQVRLTVGGAAVHETTRGDVLTWRATRGGGISLTATGVHGFVTYVGQLRLR
jgi:hypothetical protein